MGALGLPGGRGGTAGALTGGMPRGMNNGMNRALGRIPENPLTSAAGLGGASATSPQTGTHPVLGGLPGAAASGGARDGRASPSAGGAGGSVTGPIGGAVGGAGNNGAGVAAKSGAHVAKGAAGLRMMPMMGGAARGGENEKRIKSVTTQVERDPNKRDLLGESPAVLPGVIGEWARDAD